MKAWPLLLLILLTLTLAGCSSMKVSSDADPAFDFSRIRTYRWIDGPADILAEADTYIHEDIHRALDDQLLQRGLKPVKENADVQVAYYVKLSEQVEYTDSTDYQERNFSGGFVYDPKNRSWSYAEREPDLNVYTVEIGKLTVLVYDTAGGRRIWRGTLQTKLDRSLPKEQREERIRTAAEKLIARLPVVSKE